MITPYRHILRAGPVQSRDTSSVMRDLGYSGITLLDLAPAVVLRDVPVTRIGPLLRGPGSSRALCSLDHIRIRTVGTGYSHGLTWIPQQHRAGGTVEDSEL